MDPDFTKKAETWINRKTTKWELIRDLSGFVAYRAIPRLLGTHWTLGGIVAGLVSLLLIAIVVTFPFWYDLWIKRDTGLDHGAMWLGVIVLVAASALSRFLAEYKDWRERNAISKNTQVARAFSNSVRKTLKSCGLPDAERIGPDVKALIHPFLEVIRIHAIQATTVQSDYFQVSLILFCDTHLKKLKIIDYATEDIGPGEPEEGKEALSTETIAFQACRAQRHRVLHHTGWRGDCPKSALSGDVTEYRTVFWIPIVHSDGDETRTPGCILLKSSHPYHFIGRSRLLITVITPYVLIISDLLKNYPHVIKRSLFGGAS